MSEKSLLMRMQHFFNCISKLIFWKWNWKNGTHSYMNVYEFFWKFIYIYYLLFIIIVINNKNKFDKLSENSLLITMQHFFNCISKLSCTPRIPMKSQKWLHWNSGCTWYFGNRIEKMLHIPTGMCRNFSENLFLFTIYYLLL